MPGIFPCIGSTTLRYVTIVLVILLYRYAFLTLEIFGLGCSYTFKVHDFTDGGLTYENIVPAELLKLGAPTKIVLLPVAIDSP